MSEEATVAEQEAPTTTEPQAVEQVQERFDSARVREATPPPDFVPPSEDGEMHDMMVKRLYEDMGVIVEDEKAKDEPAPEPEVKEEPEVKDEQPSSPEVEEPKEEEPEKPRTTVQGKDEFKQDFIDSIRDVVRDETSRGQKRDELPVPPEPEPQPVAQEDELDGLLDEQKMEIELLAFAENEMPDKYKGIKDKTLKFYKELEQWIATKSKEDEEFSIENNSEDIDKFIAKNKPSVSKVDEKKLERGMIRRQALSEFQRESDSKFRELEHKTKLIEERPKIRAEADQFIGSILNVEGIEATDMMLNGKGAEASEKFPMETQVINNVASQAARIYEDYLYFQRGLSTFEEAKDTLSYLDKFLSAQGNWFAQNGGDSRYRDGKQFVPVAEYTQMASTDNSTGRKYWTFDNVDVRELLAADSRSQIKSSINQMEQQISQYGYVRKATESEDQQKEKPKKKDVEPVTPPVATVSASPGQGEGSAPEEPNHPGNNVIDALGLRQQFPDFVE